MGGTVSWDCPVTDSGEIPDKVYEQLAVLSRKVSQTGQLASLNE
jgi:hypothetical protein